MKFHFRGSVFMLIASSVVTPSAIAQSSEQTPLDTSYWSDTATSTFRSELQKTNINFEALIPSLRSAAAKGDPWAQGFLGHLLLEEQGTSQAHDEGMRFLRSSAE